MKNLQYYLLIILLQFIIFSAEENLNILQFESERDLKKYMKSISKDLGVRCSYCHDMNDKSIETKNKVIAREMIIMQKNLNHHFFAQMGDSISQNQQGIKISCWTCHRGSPIPELVRLRK